MATIEQWTPFGAALSITATAGTITRTSSTKFTVVLNVSWKCYWSGNSTWYGMSATSGGVTKTITDFGSAHSSGSSSFTGTYSISGNGAQTKSITVTFKNFNTETGESASKSITLNVSVPAWPTYTVKYNANGGSGAPSSQTKVKGTTLKLSTTKPTRTGYTFQGWGTTASDTSVNYAAGANYTSDAAITLYAIWKANTYTIKFDANGGTGAPADQTKTYGQTLTLSSTKPTRTNYNFLGWALSSTATTATYSAGGSYTNNSAATLYAVWELAYWKPKITNVLLGRCDSAGNDDDLGLYFKIAFSWECCQLLGANNVSSISVSWKELNDSTYTNSETLTPSGTISGNQSRVLGGSLDADVTYDILITVTDSTGGSTALTTTISSYSYVIDYKAGGKGVKIGGPSINDGFEVGFKSFFEDEVTFANFKRLYWLNSAGEPQSMVVLNNEDDQFFGFGGYSAGVGHTYLDGNELLLRSNGSRIRASKPVETHFRTRRCNTEQTLETSAARLKMNYSTAQGGDLIVGSDDGGITCLIDGYVIVYGTVYALEMTAGNMLGAYILKEDVDGVTTTGGLAAASTGNKTYVSVDVAVRIISVSAGDTIYLCAYNLNSATGKVAANSRTNLTVQYV